MFGRPSFAFRRQNDADDKNLTRQNEREKIVYAILKYHKPMSVRFTLILRIELFYECGGSHGPAISDTNVTIHSDNFIQLAELYAQYAPTTYPDIIRTCGKKKKLK